ncbi:unnamed protein product [Prunus armeniaca]|uniref:F-box associated domain-containing protein n=1 Tax=Prunus armeniaca TaxID=36596 RepID=A0A6J5UZ33_PRUAR|nr:unnamed protein product [Prunus armeniaca]CAB4312208.1 unnamed protein product [Prunus armeniaca]
MEDGFAFQMQRVPIPTLYLCFAENKQGNKVSYRIISVRLMDGMHAEIVKPEFQVVGYKSGEGLPLGMGFGIFRSNIILAGGLEAVYDGYTNFPSNPRKDVYQFDDNSTYTIPFLQQGKSCPFLAITLLPLLQIFSAGHHFTPSFEMFDPKEGKWASLPEPPPFTHDYLKHDPFTAHAVVGSNIFVSSIFCPIFCFNMDDPNQEWKEHEFNMDDPSQEWDCQGLPMEFNGQALAMETKDGDWVILSCTPQSDPIEAGDDIDEDDHDEYDQDNFDLEEHHYHHARPPSDYEWWGTSICGYLMSKDCKSLKLLKDLKMPEGILPRNRQRVRGMQFKLVHLGEQKVCLVMCVDYVHEPKDVEIHVIGFEFQLLPSRDALYFTMLNDVSQFTYHADGPSEPSTTGIYIHGAFLL